MKIFKNKILWLGFLTGVILYYLVDAIKLLIK